MVEASLTKMTIFHFLTLKCLYLNRESPKCFNKTINLPLSKSIAFLCMESSHNRKMMQNVKFVEVILTIIPNFSYCKKVILWAEVPELPRKNLI